MSPPHDLVLACGEHNVPDVSFQTASTFKTSLTCLTSFAANHFVGVAHALAQIRFRRTQLTDVRCNLSNHLLVDADHAHGGGVTPFDLERDVFRRTHHNFV